MKKNVLLLLLIGFVLAFQSCQTFEEETYLLDQLAGLEDLPTTAQEEIERNYAEYEVESVELEDFCFDEELYEVELEDGPNDDELDLFFDTNGNLKYFGKKIDTFYLRDNYPEVFGYLDTAFTDYKIHLPPLRQLEDLNGTLSFFIHIKTSDYPGHVVLVLQVSSAGGVEVLCFNRDDDDDDDDDDEPEEEDDDPSNDVEEGVDPAAAAAIRAYLDEFFPDYDQEGIEFEDVCGDDDYLAVEIEDGPGPDLELYFDLTGTYQFTISKIDFENFPEPLLIALDTLYEGYTPDTNKIKMVETDAGEISFLLTLWPATPGKVLKVQLSLDGTVLCSNERDDDDSDDGDSDDGDSDDDDSDDDDSDDDDSDDGDSDDDDSDDDNSNDDDSDDDNSNDDDSDDDNSNDDDSDDDNSNDDDSDDDNSGDDDSDDDGSDDDNSDDDNSNNDDSDDDNSDDDDSDDDDSDDDDSDDYDDDEEDSVQKNVLSYLRNNFPSYRFGGVRVESFCNGDRYVQVRLEDGDGPDLKAYFSTDGDFLFTTTLIEEGDLPTEVMTTINDRFGDYELDTDKIEELTFADETTPSQYVLRFKPMAGPPQQVIISAAGEVLCD